MGNFAISSAGFTAVLNDRIFDQAGISTGSGRIPKPEKAASSTKDYKLERILTKFRSGKKLTSGELSYVARENPNLYQKILRVLTRREMVEKRLEAAKTKEEEEQIMAQEMKSVEHIEDAFEKEATVNHLMDAWHEHISSGATREKPDTNRELTEEQQKERDKRTVQPMDKEKEKEEEAPDEGITEPGNPFFSSAEDSEVKTVSSENGGTKPTDYFSKTAPHTRPYPEEPTVRRSRKGSRINVKI